MALALLMACDSCDSLYDSLVTAYLQLPVPLLPESPLGPEDDGDEDEDQGGDTDHQDDEAGAARGLEVLLRVEAEPGRLPERVPGAGPHHAVVLPRVTLGDVLQPQHLALVLNLNRRGRNTAMYKVVYFPLKPQKPKESVTFFTFGWTSISV